VHYSAGFAGNDADAPHILWYRLLEGGIEQPLLHEAVFQRFKLQIESSEAILLHFLHIKLVGAGFGIQAHITVKPYPHTVLGPESEPCRRLTEHGTVDGGFLILQGEVPVTRYMALQVADLPHHANGAQHGVGGQHPANIFVQLPHR